METGELIEKPWGSERILDLNSRYCVKHLLIKAGHRISEQYHCNKRETMMMLHGPVELTLGSIETDVETLLMQEGTPYIIEPGVIHRLRAPGPEDGLVLEISSTELDDVVRLNDDYGRV